MRSDALLSESAQWQTTSWADQSAGEGRHWRTGSGTAAKAATRRAGPAAYWAISCSRSTADSPMSLDGGRKIRSAHEVHVHTARARPALRDGPHDQRLSALHVATCEDTGDARHPVRVAPHVAALGHPHTEVGDHA